MITSKHPSEWTQDEFIAAVLREYPELKIDYMPDGTRAIRGTRVIAKVLAMAKAFRHQIN